MPARAEQSQAEKTRAEILHHAIQLFSHYGFWKTNIGDIAECCCMSPGNLYRYFKNKQAIGLAAVRAYFDMVEAAVETVTMFPEGTAEERIRRMLETKVEHLSAEIERNPKIVELAEFLMEDEKGLEILQDHIAWKRGRLAREIQRGIDEGSFAPCDPEATAATVLSALKAFWMPMTLARWHDKSTILPEFRAIVDLLIKGLRLGARPL